MPQENSVLHQMMQQLAWTEFSRLVAEHAADADERPASWITMIWNDLPRPNPNLVTELGKARP